MKQIALLDNDFVQKLAEITGREDKEDLIRKVFDAMNVVGKMHELVYKNEFIDRCGSMEFFNHGVFLVHNLVEIFEDDPYKKEYYCILVSELYKKKTGNDISCIGIHNVLTDWTKMKSF